MPEGAETPVEKRPMEMRRLVPPPWRSVLSGNQDLGFPDFFPARPGNNQPEDVITEQNAKYGFQGTSIVSLPTENLTVHGPITTKLKPINAMENLSKLVDEIMAVRRSQAPAIPPWSFKLPNRVVYNEHMRASFISDLASPTFPLHRLAKSVPHGYKGQELLEMLWTNEVPVDRGLWLIQALGAHEVQAIRNRPGTSASALISPSDQYSTEFTGVFCAFLKKQLQEIVLPFQVGGGAPTAGRGMPLRPAPAAVNGQPFRSILSEGETRDRWLKKWEYSLSLLRTLAARSLLCYPTLALFFTEQISASNPAQLGFVLAALEEHLEKALDLGGTVVGRGLVKACADQLAEVRGNSRRASLYTAESLLTSILKTACDGNPEVLFTPTTWRKHGELLEEILAVQAAGDIEFDQIIRRNERMLLRKVQTKGVLDDSNDKKTMSDIQILDSISSSSDMKAIYYSYCGKSATHFECTESESRRKVHALLSWSIDFPHLSNHRPYACGTMLQMSKEDPQAFGRRSKGDRLRWLENFIYEWLDTSPATLQEHKMNAIGLVVGELTRKGLFSYGDYLKMINAQKFTGNSQDKETASRHLHLLKHLPIYSNPPALLYQRKIALYGFDKPDLELAEIEAVRKELGAYLSELNTGYDPPTANDESYHDLPVLRSASRYVQVQVRLWLVPVLNSAWPTLLEKAGPQEQLSLAKVFNLMETARGNATIYDAVVKLLPRANGLILKTTLDVIARHMDGWAAMDHLKDLTTLICERFITLIKQGVRNKDLIAMLQGLHSKGCITDAALQVLLDASVAPRDIKVNSTLNSGESVPPALLTVQNIQRETDLARVDKIARDLWQRFEHDASFPQVVWSNALEGLRMLHASRPGPSTRQVATLSVASLLSTIAELRPEGLESTIKSWCDSQLSQHFSQIGATGPDSPIAELFGHLLAMGVITRATMLDHLLYPTWNFLIKSKTLISGTATDMEVNLLSFSTNLMELFFLARPTADPAFPLHDLVNVQTYRTGLASLFDDTKALRVIIDHLAIMVVLEIVVSNRTSLAASLRSVREGISIIPGFKTGAFRNLDYLKDAFLSRKLHIGEAALLDAAMVEALLLIMTEVDESQSNPSSASYDWTNAVAAMSPWHWKRTVLELRLSFKRLSMQGQTYTEGYSVTDNQELSAILEQQLSDDQLALVREALKGIDTVAVQQLVRVGVNRITRLIRDLASKEPAECSSARSHIDCVIDILALALNHLDGSQSSAGPHPVLPGIMECFQGIRVMMTELATSMASVGDDPMGEDLGQDRLEACLRLVQCLLLVTHRLPGSLPIEKRHAVMIGMLNPIFAVCMALAMDPTPTALESIDTFAYVLDEIPPERRPASNASLSQYTKKLKESSIHPHTQIWSKIAELLPLRTFERWQDSQDSTTSALSDDRRWEFLPYLQPEPASLPHRDDTVQNSQPANNGSISLEAFGAVYTGDRTHVNADEAESSDSETSPELRPWELFISERDIGEGFKGESPFVRDWMAGSVTSVRSTARFHSSKETISKDNAKSTASEGTPGTTTASAGQPTPVGNSTSDPIEIVDDDDDLQPMSLAVPVVPTKRPGTDMTVTSDIDQIPAMKKQKLVVNGVGMVAKKTPRKTSIGMGGKAGKKLPIRATG